MAYTPAFKKQLTGTPLGASNCGPASAAMLADAATLGLVNVTADQMRAATGDTSGGTDMAALTTGLAHYGVHVTGYDALDALGWAGVRTKVAGGRAVIAAGDYDRIPAALRGDKDFTGYHSVCMVGASALSVRVGDPLNDGRRPGIPKGYVNWPNAVGGAYMAAYPGSGYTCLVMQRTTAKVRVAVANIRSGPGTGHAVIARRERGRIMRASCKPDIGQSVGGDRRWWRVWLSALNRVGYVHASVVTISTVA